VANRQERQESRRQLGEACIVGGALALIGTPIIYRLRAASAHVPAKNTWWWPTWWMVVPLLVLLFGVLINVLPSSFDLRRAITRGRAAARRRDRS
jgi:hypothetical protein